MSKRKLADVEAMGPKDPEQEGHEAFLSGRTFNDNPYDEGTDDYHAWNHGWDDAWAKAAAIDEEHGLA